MTPFKLAWKITQFVLWITLLLGVIPSALFYGGVYAIAKYEAWQEVRQETKEAEQHLAENAKAVCIAFDDGTWGLIPQQNIDAALKDGGHIVPCA
jgi:ABC-type multidrug transport system fused ATPase/permease subunit